MKTPAQIMANAPGRLAEILRRGIRGERRTPAEIEQLEREWADRERAERTAHKERQAAEWIEHLERCGAPPRVAEAARKLDDTPAVQAARRCLAERRQSLVLSGWTGAGKTVAACLLFGAACRQETRTGYGLSEWDSSRGLFVDFRHLLRVTDDRRNYDLTSAMSPTEKRLFETACQVKVLVLDEVGGEPGEMLNATHKKLLEELVNHRDAPGRITAYTTNLSLHRKGDQPSDFAAYVGARCMSRIGRSCISVDCGTRDLRRSP